MSDGTTIFFSPSLYLIVRTWPSVDTADCSTLPLVMVLEACRSQPRCPSPAPRMASGKMCTSSAFWLPSACGMPATPT